MSFGFVNPNPVYTPQAMFISAITQANPAVVTTTTNNNYLSGLIVRLVIPLSAGMPQIGGIEFPITVLSPTTFSVPVDSTSFDPFVNPAGAQAVSPQVIPTGEINEILYQAVQNIL